MEKTHYIYKLLPQDEFFNEVVGIVSLLGREFAEFERQYKSVVLTTRTDDNLGYLAHYMLKEDGQKETRYYLVAEVEFNVKYLLKEYREKLERGDRCISPELGYIIIRYLINVSDVDDINVELLNNSTLLIDGVFRVEFSESFAKKFVEYLLSKKNRRG